VYTQSDNLGDKFIKSLAYVLDGVKPGIVSSGQKIGDALSNDLTKGGKPMNLFDELLALFTGTRIIRIDVKKDLRYFTSTMNRLLRAVDETEGFYDVKNFASKTPNDMAKTFNEMQKEAFRIQKDMYIRIKDLQLLDLDEDRIYEIMKKSGTPKKTIRNLLNGVFTPVNYSKPRFKSKVQAVDDQMERLNKDNKQFLYSTNEDFVFPREQLDEIKSAYTGMEFFPETFNMETKKYEGGYYPDEEKYKTNKQGRLIYDDKGKPVREDGFIKENIKKLPSKIKDLVLPGSPGFTSKPQTPPLPNTPMPVQMASNTQQKDPQTNLTRNQEALLSPTEKVIASRT